MERSWVLSKHLPIVLKVSQSIQKLGKLTWESTRGCGIILPRGRRRVESRDIIQCMLLSPAQLKYGSQTMPPSSGSEWPRTPINILCIPEPFPLHLGQLTICHGTKWGGAIQKDMDPLEPPNKKQTQLTILQYNNFSTQLSKSWLHRSESTAQVAQSLFYFLNIFYFI